MADVIAFTRNYDDLSNESEPQFEFRCDRCGDGGAPLTKPTCPSCGHGNALTAKFCSECGAKLR